MHQRKEKTTEKFSCDKLYTDHIQKVTSEKVIINDEKKQPTYIHIYVNFYSSVKQGKLVQFFTRNFQIFKKVYLQILKTFIYTTKITKTPFNTKK